MTHLACVFLQISTSFQTYQMRGTLSNRSNWFTGTMKAMPSVLKRSLHIISFSTCHLSNKNKYLLTETIVITVKTFESSMIFTKVATFWNVKMLLGNDVYFFHIEPKILWEMWARITKTLIVKIGET